MDMSDAFNNYCLNCDQLCAANAIYCSSQCRDKDGHHPVPNLDVCSADIVSPLLTPSLYLHHQQAQELVESPLLLPLNLNDTSMDNLVLNYSVNSLLQSTKVPNLSTSQNYRLWLTGSI